MTNCVFFWKKERFFLKNYVFFFCFFFSSKCEYDHWNLLRGGGKINVNISAYNLIYLRQQESSRRRSGHPTGRMSNSDWFVNGFMAVVYKNIFLKLTNQSELNTFLSECGATTSYKTKRLEAPFCNNTFHKFFLETRDELYCTPSSPPIFPFPGRTILLVHLLTFLLNALFICFY